MCCGGNAPAPARRGRARRGLPASAATTPASGRGDRGDSSIALRRMVPPKLIARVRLDDRKPNVAPHLQLFDEASLTDWVGKSGGHAEQFAAAYTSFGVNNQTVRADQLVEKYGIAAVPTMTVNGEYQALGKNLAEMLLNTDRLIAQAQTEAHAAGTGAKHK